MSTPEDDCAREKLEADKKAGLKQFLALQVNNKRTADEQVKYQELLKAYGAQVVKNPKLIKEAQQKEDVDVSYAIAGVQKSILEQIIKDYEETPGRKAEQRNGGTVFAFANQEEAVAFFKTQADKGRPFEVNCIEKDHCMYSDGMGVFVHGTKVEVQAYKKNPDAFDLGEDGALKKKEPQEEEQRNMNFK